MWAFFSSSSLYSSPQLLFQQLGPSPTLLSKPAVDSMAQGTPAPSQPALFTVHCPIIVTGKFCNRDGKGGDPINSLLMHVQLLKVEIQAHKDAEPRQTGNSVSVLPFGMDTALIAEQ